VALVEKYKGDLEALIALGTKMYADLQLRNIQRSRELREDEAEAALEIDGAFEDGYQLWYTEASALVKQLVPDRHKEFENYYLADGKQKGFDISSFTIQHWLLGIRSDEDDFGIKHFDDLGAMMMRFGAQRGILDSVNARFESSLFDIRQVVQADLFDSELDSARELLRHKFLRGSGAIVGVVLEKHLQQVAASHGATTRKKTPTISVYNDLLKKHEVIDTPMWRFIQRLGDLRNLCDHNKEREPTESEVEELIRGAEKITKTLF
jgi:hypothetical protein